MMIPIGHKKDNRTECMIVKTPNVESCLDVLEGIVAPHNDVLVIQAIIANYDVT